MLRSESLLLDQAVRSEVFPICYSRIIILPLSQKKNGRVRLSSASSVGFARSMYQKHLLGDLCHCIFGTHLANTSCLCATKSGQIRHQAATHRSCENPVFMRACGYCGASRTTRYETAGITPKRKATRSNRVGSAKSAAESRFNGFRLFVSSNLTAAIAALSSLRQKSHADILFFPVFFVYWHKGLEKRRNK